MLPPRLSDRLKVATSPLACFHYLSTIPEISARLPHRLQARPHRGSPGSIAGVEAIFESPNGSLSTSSSYSFAPAESAAAAADRGAGIGTAAGAGRGLRAGGGGVLDGFEEAGGLGGGPGLAGA